MKKLEDLSSVENLFKDYGITPNWLYALIHGYTKLYDDNTLILNYYINDDVCVINSGSVGDKRFSPSIIKDIMRLVAKYDKVVLSSSVREINGYMNKLNFRYNEEMKSYIRGI